MRSLAVSQYGDLEFFGDEFDGFDAALQPHAHGAVYDMEHNNFAQVEPGLRTHSGAERALAEANGVPLDETAEFYERSYYGYRAITEGKAARITYSATTTVDEVAAGAHKIMDVLANPNAMSVPARRKFMSKMQTLAELTGHDSMRVYEFHGVGLVRNATMYDKIIPVIKYSRTKDSEMVDGLLDIIRAVYLNIDNQFTDEVRSQMMNGFADVYGEKAVADVIGATEEMIRAQVRGEEMYQMFNQLIGGAALSPERATADLLEFGPTYLEDAADPFYSVLERAVEVGQDLGLKLGPITPKGKALTAKSAKEALKGGRGRRGIIQESITEVQVTPGFVDPHIFKVGGDLIGSQLVQEDIGKFMESWLRNEASIYTSLGLANVKQGMNQFMKWWKGMATVARPTFHIRNTVSGVWMNQTIGVRARDYAEVRAGMIQIRNILDKGKDLGEALASISNPTRRAKFEALFDSGLLDVSFSRASFAKMTNVDRAKLAEYISLGNPFSGDFGLIRGGARVMETTEDFLRASAFFAWVDPKDLPGTTKVAKEMALAVHFDYQHLSNWETKVKELVPFFVWARRNVPLQLQIMLEQPGMMNRYQHLMNAASDQFPDVEQDEFPVSDYWHAQAVGTDLVMNADTPFWARVVLDPDLPVTDLLELGNIKDFASHMFGMIGPQWTAPIDMLQQQEYGDVNAPQPLGAVLRALGNIGFWDVPADGNSVEIPYAVRTLYNTIFPFAKETLETPLGLTDPKQAAQLGAPGGNVGSRLGLGLAKGLGVKVQTPAMTPSVGYRTDQRINDVLGDLRQTGQIGRTEEEEFQDRWRSLSSEERTSVWEQISGP